MTSKDIETTMKLKLIESMLIDNTKEQLDKFERAKAIRFYLNHEKISGRELSRQTNIPKSTIEDWLLWEKITRTTYNKLIDTGLTHKEIYKGLRENKTQNKEKKDFLVERIQKDHEFYQAIKEESLNQERINQLTILKTIIKKITDKWNEKHGN